jgi:hypothetical protein
VNVDEFAQQIRKSRYTAPLLVVGGKLRLPARAGGGSFVSDQSRVSFLAVLPAVAAYL